jgi:hypothetical protein
MKKPSKTNKLFKGKESYKEEFNEAKAIKSGKLSPKQYATGEKSEDMKKMKKGGKTKCYADGGETYRDATDAPGAYNNIGAQARRLRAEDEAAKNIKGGSEGPTRPYSNKFADEGATAVNTRVKPPMGSLLPATKPSTPSSRVQTGMTLEEAKSGKTTPVAAKKPVVAKKPVGKRAASKPSMGGISAADLESFRQENMADRAKADLGGSANEDNNLPVGAEAYKKGGKAKCMKSGGNVRGHGAERTGRTKGRFI